MLNAYAMLVPVAITLSLAVPLAPVRMETAKVAVDLELVLAVDLSLSMSADELALQRDGYVQALRDPALIEAIKSGPTGRIAVTYFEWGGSRSQSIVVPWTIISSAADASGFADVLAAHSIQRSYTWDMGTSISASLAFAHDLFEKSATHSDRRTIDISGDGYNNSGDSVPPVRDAVVAEGISINGLPIELQGAGGIYSGPSRHLRTYFEDCVIGGPGAFVIEVDDITRIEAAISHKLAREIIADTARVESASAVVGPRLDTVCSNPG